MQQCHRLDEIWYTDFLHHLGSNLKKSGNFLNLFFFNIYTSGEISHFKCDSLKSKEGA